MIFKHNFNIISFCAHSPLFNKDNFFVALLIISNVKGDWDAEKVIDIPNKKVIELRKKCKDFYVCCTIR